MKAYKSLIKQALKDGLSVSVFDGEVWELKKSTAYKEIIDTIESVEESSIRLYTKDKVYIGWALIVPFGVDDDETIADFSVTDDFDDKTAYIQNFYDAMLKEKNGY